MVEYSEPARKGAANRSGKRRSTREKSLKMAPAGAIFVFYHALRGFGLFRAWPALMVETTVGKDSALSIWGKLGFG